LYGQIAFVPCFVSLVVLCFVFVLFVCLGLLLGQAHARRSAHKCTETPHAGLTLGKGRETWALLGLVRLSANAYS
jgi:hypothetical protein